MKFEKKLLDYIESIVGDSWYFLDIEKFEENYKMFLTSFINLYKNTKIAYSYKTNYIPLVCKKVDELGGFAEVVSDMEYSLALYLGVNPANIIVNGPYKPVKALEKYLLSGSIVNLDSYTEFRLLKELAKRHSESEFNVGIRCNFEINSQKFSRFGFDINDENFFNIFKELKEIPNVRFMSLHCHYPNRDVNSFIDRVEKMIDIYEKVNYDGYPYYIDIGGGFGGKIDDFIKTQLMFNVGEYSDYADLITSFLINKFKKSENNPTLLLEPGTALIADTMQFICKVIDIKKIRNRYIAITSGSKINYHSRSSKINLPIIICGDNKNDKTYYESIDISGYTCMEDDYIYKGYAGNLAIGDFIIVNNVGSYSIVFKPPFINPNVPIISYLNDKFYMVKEAEDFEYIFKTYKKEWSSL